MTASPSGSFRAQLERWHDLLVRRRQVEQALSRQEARRATIEDRLSPDGILSAFAYRMEPNGDIRPQGGHGDKVLALLTKQEEEAEAVRLSIALLTVELQDIDDALQSIEGELETASDWQRRACERMFRDRAAWQTVCEELRVSKSRLYALIAETVTAADRWR